MNVKGWELLMDNGIAIVTAAIIGATVSVIGLIVSNATGWGKIRDKIGTHKSDTLEGQHDAIKELVINKHDSIINNSNTIEKVVMEKTDNLKEFQDKEFTRIFNKVDNVNGIVLKSEARYENLNLDQRNIKDTMDKLLNEWQNLSNENNRLKEKNKELQEELEKIKKQEKDKSYEREWERDR